jgi:dipeptidyl aminopeptidase/acylaminoacyl peptidase
MSPKHSLSVLGLAIALACSAHVAQAQYAKPPEPLLSVMRAPVPASPMLDPTGRRLLMVQPATDPSIARLAEPYVKLAGVRIEPRLHVRHDVSSGYGIRECLEGFALVDVGTRARTPARLPAGTCPDYAIWAPDGRHVAIETVTDAGAQLWIADASTGAARRIEGVRLNPILEQEMRWAGPSALIVKQVPKGLGPAPRIDAVPEGPEMKDAQGGRGESSTYEARDTLGSPRDEAHFDYYATSQLAKVDVASGRVTPIGAPGVHTTVDVAPDGRHVLVETLKRPYSYVTTYNRFARDVAVIDLQTGTRHVVAALPVADRVPVQGVPTGPRSFAWRANAPATLTWAEALDQGDWKVSVPARDRVMTQSAPFDAPPREIARTAQRYAGIAWFETGSQALLSEFDANRRWRRTVLRDMDDPSRAPERVLWDLSLDERYANPGTPVMRRLPSGAAVVRRDGDAIYLSGPGGSTAGDRPFLDRLDLATGATTRLFRSAPDAYERFVGFAADGVRLVTWHESIDDPPNAFVRTPGAAVQATTGEPQVGSTAQAITDYPDPTPEVRKIKKTLVTYKRDDGVDLSFTLYTPPGYQAGTRLPAILYAYPLDYADPSKAGQVSGSQQTFTRLANYRLLLLAGYAIIDNAAFPIVGDPRNAYDTYIEQLTANARAAVDKAVELGVVDRERVGITGHSHGALMAANLLAWSDLFRAGVATSGGYNKALTPFGFQNERRSVWAAPEVYNKASAFFHADKIDEPLLIVHGEDDANPGTEPTQSPRLFQAIRGLGGTTRLVMLPFEPHWYTAQESNEHVAAEMLSWFDKYVKNAPPRAATAAGSK